AATYARGGIGSSPPSPSRTGRRQSATASGYAPASPQARSRSSRGITRQQPPYSQRHCSMRGSTTASEKSRTHWRSWAWSPAAVRRGDFRRAQSLHAESLAIRRTRHDRRDIAHSLSGLGAIATRQGNYLRADVLYTESAAHYRAAGDRKGVASTLVSMGYLAE